MQRPHLTVIARETDLYGASPNDSAGRGCKMSVGTCGKSCAHQTCVTTVLDLSCGAHPTVPRVRTIQLPERHVFLTLALGMVPFSGPKPLWMQSRVLVHLPSAHDSSLRERPGGAEFSRVLCCASFPTPSVHSHPCTHSSFFHCLSPSTGIFKKLLP